jgi:NAD(P)-dependent dehydrogenase (short-subunit alcohol dehydrogenase family)
VKDFKDKVAVITGAGSGLGRALALQLHQEGAALALLDIDPTSLEGTGDLLSGSSHRVSLHVADVGRRDEMEKAAIDVLNRHQRVDLLINNAGIILASTIFEEVSDNEFVEITQVNVWGLYHGIRVFLPYLKRRPESSIVNISSVAGLVGLPGYSPYVMSKFAVRGLSEALQVECAGTGLHVLVVYPSGIKTNIMKNIPGLNESAREAANRSFSKYARLTSDAAALKILRAVRSRRLRLILGWDGKVVAAIHALFPGYFPSILRALSRLRKT